MKKIEPEWIATIASLVALAVVLFSFGVSQ